MRTLLVILAVLALTGCKSTPRHQRGGSSEITPAAAVLRQPENPEGTSSQQVERTITTIHPTTGVVTISREAAATSIGGSQSLTDIIKQSVGAENLRNSILALALAFTAFFVRREWPMIAAILCGGAVFVALFGYVALLVTLGVSGGIFIAYQILSARMRLPLP